jgi:hypothetical protein
MALERLLFCYLASLKRIKDKWFGKGRRLSLV